MQKVDRNDGETVDLPVGWQRCDGSTIEHPSPWAGQLTPDLNNEKRFLRGGHDSDQLKVEDDSIKSHSHNMVDKFFYNDDCPSGSTVVKTWNIENAHSDDDHLCQEEKATGSMGAEETKPKNMNVIFIIRVF